MQIVQIRPHIQVQGGETTVEVGDMIIITNVQHFDYEGGVESHNEASLIIVQNNLEIFKGGTSVSDWQNGEGVTKAKQVYAFVRDYVTEAISNISDLTTISEKLSQLEVKVGSLETEVGQIKTDLASGKYHTSWEGE